MRDSIDQSNVERAGDTTEFVFVGSALALDFVNTEVIIRGKRRDLLTSAGNVVRWWEAARQIYSKLPIVPFTNHAELDPATLLRASYQLRETMRGIWSAVVEQRAINDADLVQLNTILGLSTQRLERLGDTELQVAYQPVQNWHDAMLFSIARSGFELLTEGDLSRVHHCSNERCILFFYDTTRSATRQWCSLGCMNRARSAKRYRQTKAQSGK
jgi:predicted RNA-binding Zn ribbon-like protein